MTIHHSKHHNTYVTNLNAALEKLDTAVSSSDVSEIIALQGALKFNGGGHINHSLFWENLCPEKKSPKGSLEAKIKESFGGFDEMKSEFSAKTIGKQLEILEHFLVDDKARLLTSPASFCFLNLFVS